MNLGLSGRKASSARHQRGSDGQSPSRWPSRAWILSFNARVQEELKAVAERRIHAETDVNVIPIPPTSRPKRIEKPCLRPLRIRTFQSIMRVSRCLVTFGT